jgi:serine/threonine-protein kinase
VLGALAIVIAILIVLNAQDRQDRESPPPTITNTITETTPFQSPTAQPRWSDRAGVGDGEQQIGVSRSDAIAWPAKVQVTPSAPEQTWPPLQT